MNRYLINNKLPEVVEFNWNQTGVGLGYPSQRHCGIGKYLLIVTNTGPGWHGAVYKKNNDLLTESFEQANSFDGMREVLEDYYRENLHEQV